MPRTLDPILEAALDSGNFTPIIRAWLGDDQLHSLEVTIIKYKINKTSLQATCYTEELNTYTEISIERGALINGIEYTTFSLPFTITHSTLHRKIITIQAVMGEDPKYSESNGYQSYSTIINTWFSGLSSNGFIPTYQDNSAAWKAYKFFPTGKQIILNNAQNFLTLIRQKYLLYVTDYIGASPLIFSVADTYARALDHTITLTENDTYDKVSIKLRKFIWKDEIQSLHESTAADYSIHNLGYLESTATFPNAFPQVTGQMKCLGSELLCTIPFHLKYVTGDKVKFISAESPSINMTVALDVTEIFDTSKEPAWYLELRSLQFLSNTDGGALPSTIERVSNYTPLNTSTFNNNLDATINNLQALAEAVDNLTLGGTYTDEQAQDAVGAMVTGNTETGIIVTYDDPTGKLNFDATHTHSALQAPPFLIPEDGEEGRMGMPGANGIAGATGAQGPTGPAVFLDAEPGEDGMIGQPGQAGSQGTQGITGSQGPMGPAVFLEAEPGNDGDTGKPGERGSDGITGAQGPMGPAVFLIAESGEDGMMGMPGPAGAAGSGGGSAAGTIVEVDFGTTLIWQGRFTITDAAIDTSKKVNVWQHPGPYTSKGTLKDEAQLAPIEILSIESLAGSAIVRWQTPVIYAMPTIGEGGARNTTINFADLYTRTPARINKVRGNIKFVYQVLT